jgi:two-component system, NtrC family, response regulator HydG
MEQATRILVIDDNRTEAEAVLSLLRDDHLECEWVGMSEAGRLIDERDFRAVITELAADGADGLEVLHRAQRRRPGAPLIILTSKGTIKSAAAAMRAGALTYLTKPVDPGALRAALARPAG